MLPVGVPKPDVWWLMDDPAATLVSGKFSSIPNRGLLTTVGPLTQTSAALRPPAVMLNGRRAAEFFQGGVASVLLGPPAAGSPLAVLHHPTTNCTVIALLYSKTLTQQRPLALTKGSTSATAAGLLYQVDSGPNWRVTVSDGVTTTLAMPVPQNLGMARTVIRKQSLSYDVKVNGSLAAPPTAASALAAVDGSAQTAIGASGASGSFSFDGYIGEVMIWLGAALTDTQLADLDAYLMVRWSGVPDNAIFYFNADAGVSLSTGKVVAMSDQSGHGNDITQPSVAIAPTFIPNWRNGHAAMQWTGIENLYRVAFVQGPQPATNTFFIAGEWGPGGIESFLLDGGSLSARQCVGEYVNGRISLSHSSLTATIGDPIPPGTPFVAVAVLDAVAYQSRVSIYLHNAGGFYGTLTPDGAPQDMNGVILGSTPIPSNNWAGKIARVAMAHGVVSPANETALVNKWLADYAIKPFAPLALPGLAVWARGDDLAATISGGATFSTIPNRGSEGGSFTTSLPEYEPQYAVWNLTSLHAPRFTGTQGFDYINRWNWAHNSEEAYFFCRLQMTTLTGFSVFFANMVGNVGDVGFHLKTTATGQLYVNVGDGVLMHELLTPGQVFFIGTPHTFEMLKTIAVGPATGVHYEFFVDGVSVGVLDVPAPSNAAAQTALIFGNYFNHGLVSNAVIPEWGKSGLPSAQQRTDVRNYLGRWTPLAAAGTFPLFPWDLPIFLLLSFWLSGLDPVRLLSLGKVTTFASHGPAAAPLLAGTGGGPTIGTVDGNDCLIFGPGPSSLILDNTTFSRLHEPGTNGTILLRVRIDVAGAVCRLFGTKNPVPTGRGFVLRRTADNRLNLVIGNGAANFIMGPAGAPTITTGFYNIAVVKTANQYDIYVNGALYLSAVAGIVLATGTSGQAAHFGGAVNGNESLDGAFCGFFHWETALTPPDRVFVENFLQNEWP